MSETFLRYLRKERDRVDAAMSRALTAASPNEVEVASLRQQRTIVDDQLERWSRDLA